MNPCQADAGAEQLATNLSGGSTTVYARAVKLRPEARDLLLFAVVGLAPMLYAAAHAPLIADAAHDEATLRVIGLGKTGVLRALDAWVAAPFLLLPVGTLAMRASLASAAFAGLLGYLLLNAARSARAESALSTLAAVVASSAVALSLATQVEASSPGGATLGACLALAPTVLARSRAQPVAVFVALGAALGYEPVVFALAVVPLSPWLWRRREDVLRPGRPLARALGATASGLTPIVLALGWRADASLAVGPFASPWGERIGPPHAVLPFLDDQLGAVFLGLAVGGAALGVWRRDSRAAAVSSLAAIALTSVCVARGAALGPDRFAVPALVLLAHVALFAKEGMAAGLGFVAETKVAFAKVSALLVGVVLLALPARQLDLASLRLANKSGAPERAFAELAWQRLPLGAVVIVSDPAISRRILASRAQGEARADVLFVRLRHASSLSALALEPRLAPLLRDDALYGAPEEWALSSLASSRPTALTFDPRWPRPLARHLVAAGLFDRFYAEPRGLSDRRDALAALAPLRLALERSLVKCADPDVASAAASLLRARLLGAAASGDRDVIGLALDDLRPFSPGDPLAFEIVRRAVGTRGPIDVSDLTSQ